MKTQIGDELTIDRCPYTGLAIVSSANPLIPSFPCLFSDSVLCKYKKRYGLLIGMMHVCRIQLKYEKHWTILPEEEQEKLKNAFAILSKLHTTLKTN